MKKSLKNVILSKFAKNNIIIGICVFFSLFLGLIGTFAYSDVDKSLTEVTDTIEAFKYREKHWSDYIGGGSSGPYLNIDLTDKGFFNATGIAYDNIDKTLFSVLQNGTEITIIYNDSRKILGIEYKDKTYLDYNVVVDEFKYNERIMKVIGPSFMILSVLVGGVFFILNYKKNKYQRKII